MNPEPARTSPTYLEVEDPRTGGVDLVAVEVSRHTEGGAPWTLRRARSDEAEALRGAFAAAPWAVFAGVRYRLPQPTPEQAPQTLALSSHAPVVLGAAEIPKPWGREIWFTGMEKRGVCSAAGVPLPWLVAAGREAFFGKGLTEIVLLKVLDPLPVPVWGDLYTEIHREKNEVYVCVGVDPAVARDGAGALRFGIAPEAWRQAGGDPAAFKARYLAAVRAYEAVRRSIDARLESHAVSHRAGIGAASDANIDARQLAAWHDALPAALLEEESARRDEMNAFTALHPLRPGDVARVPVGVPHALQAGVRVVEFQTATYERAIVSFAQKVLTQPQWDTEEALALLDVPASLASPLVVRACSDLGTVNASERIVDFPGFTVERVTRADNLALGNADAYALLFLVSGTFRTREKALIPEGASLLARGAACEVTGVGVLLVARPRH